MPSWPTGAVCQWRAGAGDVDGDGQAPQEVAGRVGVADEVLAEVERDLATSRRHATSVA